MKKVFYFIISTFLFISCSSNTTYPIEIDKSNSEFITVDTILSHKIKYKKIVIEGHDFYYRSWTTTPDYGSDLVHNPNCKTCKNVKE